MDVVHQVSFLTGPVRLKPDGTAAVARSAIASTQVASRSSGTNPASGSAYGSPSSRSRRPRSIPPNDTSNGTMRTRRPSWIRFPTRSTELSRGLIPNRLRRVIAKRDVVNRRRTARPGDRARRWTPCQRASRRFSSSPFGPCATITTASSAGIAADRPGAARQDFGDDRMIVERPRHANRYRRLHRRRGIRAAVCASCPVVRGIGTRRCRLAGRGSSSRRRRAQPGHRHAGPGRYSVDVMTELHDETNNGTATMSLTPREVRRSTAAWMFARVAIPKATSVGLRLVHLRRQLGHARVPLRAAAVREQEHAGLIGGGAVAAARRRARAAGDTIRTLNMRLLISGFDSTDDDPN